MNPTLAADRVHTLLEDYARMRVSGIQYVVVSPDQTLFAYGGGQADIQNRRAMTLDTTMMAYSMTKTFTAAAILQLVEHGQLELDDELDLYVSDNPYHHHITLRQLLTHTSGIPNPIPLKWAHLAEEHEHFDEQVALAKVLRDHPRLAFEPGTQFAYSNIGYWLLGRVVEAAASQAFADIMRANVLQPLGLHAHDMDFVVHDPTRHANGYLAQFSMMNLMKGLVTDRKFWGGYEGHWLRLRNHYLNGPAFGGLVGTARAFSCFLQDQLRADSALFNQHTQHLFETPQSTKRGELIPMTLGWHIGKLHGLTHFFKEGGGGGFHSEMRIYRTRGIGSVVMANTTASFSTALLDRLDAVFLNAL